ncbi:MAG TPA: SOS response-associated peptidase [Candidatus Avipropionibacterium avicola]|uniref:Abasic site processing protein n=1 Tax=Candidatus Avipropionibacterium avicola TaxID=2840701 RepID=A0A9D1GW35_9ACTN|nr:SOS response-associated peptidase [Candidatus Avipropionibacterium avicola]
MCGRYATSYDPDTLVDAFDVDEVDDDLPGPSWNVAPTDQVPVVMERDSKQADRTVRKLRPLHWGLVPSWAKDPSIGARMINARVETVAEKPAFRKAFAVRRCLLPADGYYEWYDTGEKTPKGKAIKQPYFIHPGGDEPMAMAGLYEYWRSPSQQWYLSCTVITTEATDALGRIHDRMPMTIARAGWSAWLDPERTDPDDAAELLEVVEPARLLSHPVSTEVGSVRNNGPHLVDPIPDPFALPEDRP